MRLIDADALLKRRRNFGKDYALDPVDKNIDDQLVDLRDVLNAPTLDYAPVVHGEWNEGFCSECGVETSYNDIDEAIFDYDWEENLRYSHTETRREYHETAFCPNCGAKMDGGKKDG